ncbi:hypothetical protein ACIRJR_32210 [Streptomyces sp. NPDC102402]|uniref:hypothetical protein n=1 Tax=Streptomyces sp. NPDC102402 TaxID=3366169 RepID=UPI00380C8BBA
MITPSPAPHATSPAEERAFLEQAVAGPRVVIRIRVSRLYGAVPDIAEAGK